MIDAICPVNVTEQVIERNNYANCRPGCIVKGKVMSKETTSQDARSGWYWAMPRWGQRLYSDYSSLDPPRIRR